MTGRYLGDTENQEKKSVAKQDDRCPEPPSFQNSFTAHLSVPFLICCLSEDTASGEAVNECNGDVSTMTYTVLRIGFNPRFGFGPLGCTTCTGLVRYWKR